jgi:hypothetical protein
MFAAPADADFTDSPEDMAGKVVGVQRGTIHQDYMERDAFPDTRLTLYASQDEAYLDLVSGRLDAVMGDSIAITQGFLETPQGEGFAQLGDIHYDPEVHGEGAGIGVRQGEDELRDRFSRRSEAIREDGTYDEIAEQYFDFDIYGDRAGEELMRPRPAPARGAAMETLIAYLPLLARGALVTASLAVLSLALATALGAARRGGADRDGAIGQGAVLVYTTVVRGIPDLVLLLLVYFGGQRLINQAGRPRRRPGLDLGLLGGGDSRSGSSTAPISSRPSAAPT